MYVYYVNYLGDMIMMTTTTTTTKWTNEKKRKIGLFFFLVITPNFFGFLVLVSVIYSHVQNQWNSCFIIVYSSLLWFSFVENFQFEEFLNFLFLVFHHSSSSSSPFFIFHFSFNFIYCRCQISPLGTWNIIIIIIIIMSSNYWEI